ncbi:hypothetical protein ABGB18_09740 [Nonomuraea sp. B12E4]
MWDADAEQTGKPSSGYLIMIWGGQCMFFRHLAPMAGPLTVHGTLVT